MDLFLSIALSFPTVIFSVLLGVAMFYWLLAMVGLVDLDIFHIHIGHGPGAEGMEFGGFAGLLMKFGFDDMPLTLILSVVTMLAWLISYFASFFLLHHLPWDVLRFALGGVVVVIAPVLALPVSGVLLRPFRGLFAKMKPVDSVSLLGEVARVRSPEVTLQQGTADVDNGGAGLILQVRAEPGQFKRGDRVVLVEYLDAQNAYRVISEGSSA
ncbi:MAG: hypothetical protein ACT4NL_01015 [Pseudomarimonas sp.]